MVNAPKCYKFVRMYEIVHETGRMNSLFFVEGHMAQPTHSDLPTKASGWCAEESSQLLLNEHISN